MESTVSGTEIAWRTVRSRSLLDQPPPFDPFRCRAMASFAPVEARGEGLPKRREEQLLGGVRAVSEEISVEECGGKGDRDSDGAAEGEGESLE